MQKKDLRIRFAKIVKNVSPSDYQNNLHSFFVKQKTMPSPFIFDDHNIPAKLKETHKITGQNLSVFYKIKTFVVLKLTQNAG
jgi:hypothetical protein